MKWVYRTWLLFFYALISFICVSGYLVSHKRHTKDVMSHWRSESGDALDVRSGVYGSTEVVYGGLMGYCACTLTVNASQIRVHGCRYEQVGTFDPSAQCGRHERQVVYTLSDGQLVANGTVYK